MIYAHTGNAHLSAQASRLYCKLKPYRRVQLRVRGRMDQSISEQTDLLDALAQAMPAARGKPYAPI